MIADLKPYPEYKESGMPWIEQVPAHWVTRRLRHVSEMRVSNVDKHTKNAETPIRLCNYVDVYRNERIRESIHFMSASASEDERIRFSLRRCDVLITKDSEQWNDIGVPSLVEFEAPDLVCGYHLAILRSRPALHGAFLHRALQCHFIAAQFHVQANGVTRFGLSQGAIRGVSIPLPPPAEQAAIVRFLDWANGRLERAIRAKRMVIALLNEQKQAIIHRAVTRGIDLSVPLKPSGIPGLGDIPQHWDTPLTQRIFKENIRPHNGSAEVQLSLSQRDGLIATRDMQERSLQTASYDNWKVTIPGDLVLNRFKAHLGVFFAATLRGMVSFHYGVFAPLRKLHTKYFELLFHTRPYRAIYAGRSNGMTVGLQNLSNQNFYNVRCVVPPLSEQVAIVEFTERETQTLNTTIFRLEREIELLREYRTRLVADVVTGKLDVREAAARLPDEAAPDLPEDDTDLSIYPESADEVAAG